MFANRSSRYHTRTGRRYHCRPELERLEDRWVLASSAFDIVSPGSVETAMPDVVVSTPADLTCPLQDCEDVMRGRDQFEGERLPPKGAYPDLPAMYLTDPHERQFEGQVVYLDFDGAKDVTYSGPVVIEGVDVPSFRLTDLLAGQEEIVIDGLMENIKATFAGTGITFTTQPPATGEYSIVYIGGDDSAFQDYGSFVGLAEQVDTGNTDHRDSAFVFSDKVLGGESSVTLPEVIVHEIGHLLGYAHISDDAGLASDLAGVAHEAATHVFITQQASHLYHALFGVAGVDLELSDYLEGPENQLGGHRE